MTIRNCGTCNHFKHEEARDEKGRMRSKLTAPCEWPVPFMPASAVRHRVVLRRMHPQDGNDCLCWKARVV